ncbi:MAG: lasso peptide biosynthesis B2 protein [Acidimicrobiales bacterium]
MSAGGAALRGSGAWCALSRMLSHHSFRTLARALPALVWVAGWMAMTEVAVRVVPIDRLSRMLGVPLRPEGSQGCGRRPGPGPVPLRPVEHRRLAVLARVGPRWPFGGGPCLRQSLVAGRVLRRLDPELQIGVTFRGEPTGGDPIVAHAWVEVAGATIGASEGFTVLAPGGAPSSVDAREVLHG